MILTSGTLRLRGEQARCHHQTNVTITIEQADQLTNNLDRHRRGRLMLYLHLHTRDGSTERVIKRKDIHTAILSLGSDERSEIPHRMKKSRNHILKLIRRPRGYSNSQTFIGTLLHFVQSERGRTCRQNITRNGSATITNTFFICIVCLIKGSGLRRRETSNTLIGQIPRPPLLSDEASSRITGGIPRKEIVPANGAVHDFLLPFREIATPSQPRTQIRETARTTLVFKDSHGSEHNLHSTLSGTRIHIAHFYLFDITLTRDRSSSTCACAFSVKRR